MKDLFLVMALVFSASVYSQAVPAPVPDNNIVIETLAIDNFTYPDYSIAISENFFVAPSDYVTINFEKMEYCENFGQAVEAVRVGKMIKRQSHPADTFIFMQVPSVINQEIVPKMTSLPTSVKKEFERRFNDERLQITDIYYTDQLARVDNSNVIRGWTPLPEDVLASDWIILG
ncbi:MAG: DUF2829 domain-containing protein [Tannerella sp.]|jgi:hypothetical protein|nr:DUF2829 domain-containing protein [Tannerella sp.]